MSNCFLKPLSWIYGTVTGVRNVLFNMQILSSKRFSTPVIVLGNLTVGGTGKTPHTEYIVEALSQEFKIATLSRGYGRKSSGFVLAEVDSSADRVGDEPLQIKRKYPHITVACDANRVNGIEKLMNMSEERPDVIILDDAFQHRYVKADKSILLVDFNRPIFEDSLLPAGRLRESASGIKRADYVIVTKCPKDISPIEQRIWSKRLKLKPYQKLFFSYMSYGAPKSLSGEKVAISLDRFISGLCVTGIASAKPYQDYLADHLKDVKFLEFGDHHHFSAKDVKRIVKEFTKMDEENKWIFTTEKDAMRLKDLEIEKEIADRIIYIPIVPVFLASDTTLTTELYDYIKRNKS